MDETNTGEGVEPFKTLSAHGESELVVERSRFLGHALPVTRVSEAEDFVAQQRRLHYDARHVCFGLRVGRGAQGVDRSNDDGEPARTGGFPLWQLLDGDDVTDALVVVVRYYGGVKLGTGGLARAYRDAGRQAIAAAGIVTRHPEEALSFHIPYGEHDRVRHFLGQVEGVRVASTDYAADVRLTLAVRKLILPELRRRLAVLLQRGSV